MSWLKAGTPEPAAVGTEAGAPDAVALPVEVPEGAEDVPEEEVADEADVA